MIGEEDENKLNVTPGTSTNGASWTFIAEKDNDASEDADRLVLPSHTQTEEKGSSVLRAISTGATLIGTSDCPQTNTSFLLTHQWKSLMSVIRRGNLVKVDLTQSGLTSEYAHVIHLALVENPRLQILKLGYNELGDTGISMISPGFVSHSALKVLDVGFNGIGDLGCAAIAKSLVGNFFLETLYLSGNSISEDGIVALSQALRQGCGILQLHLTANKIGARGLMCLAKAIADSNSAVSAEKRDPSIQCDSTPTRNEKDSVKLCDTRCLEEVYLGGTLMRSEGCLSLAKMILTNTSLRILSLPNNNLGDCDAILLAQSFSRNKQVPLEKIHLSFNRLTCVGVEALMNSFWGSQTLREIKLDNNIIKDRGAQLAAVVLTSVAIEVLDIGFNLIGTVGIKALMKTLADNTSLRSLTLSGNTVDTNSARAVSYALALNRSLKELFVDNCSVTCGAQRLIAAGIVSNKVSALRVLRGFHLGVIVITLGFPAPVENWSNDQLLKFTSLMWQDSQLDAASSDKENSTTSSPADSDQTQSCNRDVAHPQMVIKVANLIFEKMNDFTGQLLLAREDTSDVDKLCDCPTVPGNAAILEISESGSLQMPQELELLRSNGEFTADTSVFKAATRQSFGTQFPCTSQTKRRLAPFLQIHCDQLEELAKMPFNKSEMWKLHRIYSSAIDGEGTVTTVFGCSEKTGNASCIVPSQVAEQVSPSTLNHIAPPYCSEPSRQYSLPTTIYKKSMSHLHRGPSYRCLTDAVALSAGASAQCKERSRECQNLFRRHSFVEVGKDDGEAPPLSKRVRSTKLRVDLYPRIKLRMDEFKMQTNEFPALILMRQLNYLEQRNVYASTGNNIETQNKTLLSPDDIEVLLLDLL